MFSTQNLQKLPPFLLSAFLEKHTPDLSYVVCNNCKQSSLTLSPTNLFGTLHKSNIDLYYICPFCQHQDVLSSNNMKNKNDKMIEYLQPKKPCYYMKSDILMQEELVTKKKEMAALFPDTSDDDDESEDEIIPSSIPPKKQKQHSKETTTITIEKKTTKPICPPAPKTKKRVARRNPKNCKRKLFKSLILDSSADNSLSMDALPEASFFRSLSRDNSNDSFSNSDESAFHCFQTPKK